jgi:hypothetical protein
MKYIYIYIYIVKSGLFLWKVNYTEKNDFYFFRFHIRNELFFLATWGTLITKLTVIIILLERHLECLFPFDCMHVTTGEPIIFVQEIILLSCLRILQSRVEPFQFYKVVLIYFNFNSNQTIVRTHSLKESQFFFRAFWKRLAKDMSELQMVWTDDSEDHMEHILCAIFFPWFMVSGWLIRSKVVKQFITALSDKANLISHSSKPKTFETRCMNFMYRLLKLTVVERRD